MQQVWEIQTDALPEWALSCPRCHTAAAMVLTPTGETFAYRCLACGYTERVLHETLSYLSV